MGHRTGSLFWALLWVSILVSTIDKNTGGPYFYTRGGLLYFDITDGLDSYLVGDFDHIICVLNFYFVYNFKYSYDYTSLDLIMPEWVQFRANEIPVTNTASFLEILANYAGAEEVECVIADGGHCQLTGTSQSYCTSSAEHAYDTFAANAAINAADFGNLLIDSVWEAGFNTSLLSEDFVTDFSPQKVVHDITDEILEALTVGLISVVSAFISPLLTELLDMAAVTGLYDILSSHDSVINFATDTLTSASEVALKDFALESDLGAIVENELSTLSSGIQNYYDGIINGPAYNDAADYKYYALNKSGLPQLLASGLFAAPVTTLQAKRIEESTNQGFIGANILTVYELEGIYVIGTNYTEAYGSNSCSTKLTDDVAAYTYPLNGASEIVGIDKLSNYQLSLLDIAIASEFSYEQQGYDKWTTSSAIKTLTTMQMPNKLFSHLPYCRLTADDFKNIYKREDVPEVEGNHCTQGDAVCRLKTAAYEACPKQKANGKTFPLTFSK
ncbi:uncharacterized protein N7459_005673 [Penicillium hispanicum]|uniref:uncharacterized protein n=1 Tax=Penicillium hispanicum TaxID=1080232 RepID=UPI0025416592|nr:uncharacterized protein N7459_005673 [Penicillium hispanicum]KAJ5579688.1 hypothetical protein N7459_005673 [Penicillium hispanicum]